MDHGGRHCGKSFARLEAALSWLKEQRIGLIFNLGDAINGGDDHESEIRYAQTIAKAFASFPAEARFVIGNHDIELLSKEEYAAEIGGLNPGAFERSFERGGVRFIMLDGNMHGDGSDFFPAKFTWDKAYLGPKQLEWLHGELSLAGGRPVIIMCHECLDYNIWDNALDPHIVRDVDSFRSIVNGFPNVLAVIHGHYHPGRSMVLDNLPYCAFTSVVAGEFPEPGAAAVVSVMPDGALDASSRSS